MSHHFVCRNFKHIVEHLFIDCHLKLLTLDYILGYLPFPHANLYTKSQSTNSPAECDILNFEFLHLSENCQSLNTQSRHRFQELKTYHPYMTLESQRVALRESIKKAGENLIKSILHSNHVLEIAKVSNDTPIPGISIDTKIFHFTFHWEVMLSHFFGEKRYSARLSADGGPKVSCNRAEISPGVLADFDSDNASWKQEGQWDEYYKTTRRTRISKIFKEPGFI